VIILPRQARDKHRENSKGRRVSAGDITAAKDLALSRVGQGAASPHARGLRDQVRKQLSAPRFILQMTSLPRQARDKHRESTLKKKRFSRSDARHPAQWPEPQPDDGTADLSMCPSGGGAENAFSGAI
jgi:hypothetical protein